MKLAKDQAERAMNTLRAHPLAGPLVDRPSVDAHWDKRADEELGEFLDYLDNLDEDVVNHPAHYAEGWSNGAEVIDIAENLPFNRGNVVKYVARAGAKDPGTEIEDLRKAAWYLDRELARIQA